MRKLQKRISRQNSVNQDLLGQATKKVCKTTQYTLTVKACLVCVKLKEYVQTLDGCKNNSANDIHIV